MPHRFHVHNDKIKDVKGSLEQYVYTKDDVIPNTVYDVTNEERG